AARTSSVERVGLVIRRLEVAADFGDRLQAVVRRLRGVLRGNFAERPLAATAAAAAPSSSEGPPARPLAREISSPPWLGGSVTSSESSSTGAGSSTIAAKSSANDFGGSTSLLTPTAGSPRSIAW